MAATRTPAKSNAATGLFPPGPAPSEIEETETTAATTPIAEAALDGEDGREYVTFSLSGELFAFPIAQVQEIIRMPAVVRVPLSPHSLEGLANLRGHILPVVDLRACCGQARVEHDDATRVIVVNSGTPIGLVVDRVAAVLSVEPDEVQEVGSIQSTIDSDLLTSVLRTSTSDQMVPVLDVLKLVEGEFADIARQATTADAAGPSTHDEPAAEDSSDIVELVSFVVDNQEYALPIQEIQEIVRAPHTVSHVPNSDSRVVGLMDLRGALLPVVSLRRIFNLPQGELEKTHRIVVVPLPDAVTGTSAAIGVLMDTVRQVLRVPRSVVDPLPSFLAQSGRLAEVESVCRLDGGSRLVSILSAERLIAGNGLRAAIETELSGATSGNRSAKEDAVQDPTTEDGQNPDSWTSTEEQLVVFRVDNEEYCVNVDSVQEIIRVPEQLIRVPKSLAFVEGLVNLRGTVLPVVDLRTRLGLPHVEREDRQRIVVLIIGGVRTGFIVDSVAEVMKLDRTLVEDAPGLSAEQSELISEVANLTEHKRMLLILQPDHLLATSEIAALATSAAA